MIHRLLAIGYTLAAFIFAMLSWVTLELDGPPGFWLAAALCLFCCVIAFNSFIAGLNEATTEEITQ